MSRWDDVDLEIRELMAAYCDGQATADQIERLESSLADNPSAQRLFLDALQIDSELHFLVRGDHALALALEKLDSIDRGHEAEMPDRAAFPADSRAPARPHSPTLGFLGDIMGNLHWWPVAPTTLWAIVALLSCASTLVLVCVLAFHGGGWSVERGGQDKSASSNSARRGDGTSPIPNPSSSLHPSTLHPSTLHASSVARLTYLADCRWVVSNAVPQPGDRLAVGQTLQLAAGVACLEFDIGAKLMLQGPANLSIISAKQLRLDRGKLTAEITSEKAHGFTVFTPQGTLVDLGTEFGVEIAPEGSSKMHVFRGKVEVALPTANGQPPKTTQCLLAGGDARVEAGTDTMDFYADTGESFIRSLDRFKRDQHIVAYWRFDDRPLGRVHDTHYNHKTERATVDSSFNGNDLYAFSDVSQPAFSGEAPQDEVPQTHSKNRACLDFSRPVPSGSRKGPRNVYTHSPFSHAAPIDIQKITPPQWTIEASVKPTGLDRSPGGFGPQTIVGRDTECPANNKQNPPPQMSLEVNGGGHFAIHYCDADKRLHEAVAEQLPVQTNHWYHLAAVSDGRTLKLYIDDRDGSGYQLRAAQLLPKGGSTALGKGGDTAEWTVGRGLERGRPGAGFVGLIDEVRVSDIARQPAELLFAPSEAGATADPAESTKTARFR